MNEVAAVLGRTVLKTCAQKTKNNRSTIKQEMELDCPREGIRCDIAYHKSLSTEVKITIELRWILVPSESPSYALHF